MLCLTGVIDKITMPPPHLIVRDLFRMLVSGRMNAAIAKTLTNTLLALLLALGVGVIAGALLHRRAALRETLDPLFATYYAVPVFAFYPFFIVVFGLGDLPQILIAFMLGVVAMIVNTLNGLDRVPHGAAQDRAHHAALAGRHGAAHDAALGRRRTSSPASSSRSPTPSSASSARSSSCRAAASATRSASPTPTSTTRRCIR